MSGVKVRNPASGLLRPPLGMPRIMDHGSHFVVHGQLGPQKVEKHALDPLTRHVMQAKSVKPPEATTAPAVEPLAEGGKVVEHHDDDPNTPATVGDGQIASWTDANGEVHREAVLPPAGPTISRSSQAAMEQDLPALDREASSPAGLRGTNFDDVGTSPDAGVGHPEVDSGSADAAPQPVEETPGYGLHAPEAHMTAVPGTVDEFKGDSGQTYRRQMHGEGVGATGAENVDFVPAKPETASTETDANGVPVNIARPPEAPIAQKPSTTPTAPTAHATMGHGAPPHDAGLGGLGGTPNETAANKQIQTDIDKERIDAQDALGKSAAIAAAKMKENDDIKLAALADLEASTKQAFEQAHQVLGGMSPIDPNHYWGTGAGGVANRILSGLGMVAGAFGATLAHSPNWAMEYVNKQIDNDMRAQEGNNNTRLNLAKHLMDLGHTQVAAYQMTHAIKELDIADQLKTLSMQPGSFNMVTQANDIADDARKRIVAAQKAQHDLKWAPVLEKSKVGLENAQAAHAWALANQVRATTLGSPQMLAAQEAANRQHQALMATLTAPSGGATGANAQYGTETHPESLLHVPETGDKQVDGTLKEWNKRAVHLGNGQFILASGDQAKDINEKVIPFTKDILDLAQQLREMRTKTGRTVLPGDLSADTANADALVEQIKVAINKVANLSRLNTHEYDSFTKRVPVPTKFWITDLGYEDRLKQFEDGIRHEATKIVQSSTGASPTVLDSLFPPRVIEHPAGQAQ